MGDLTHLFQTPLSFHLNGTVQTLISDVCSQTLARRLKVSYFQRCLLDHRKLTHPCPETQSEDRCFTISPALYIDIFFQLCFHSAQIALCFLAGAFDCCRWFSLKSSLLALGVSWEIELTTLTNSHDLDNSFCLSPLLPTPNPSLYTSVYGFCVVG